MYVPVEGMEYIAVTAERVRGVKRTTMTLLLGFMMVIDGYGQHMTRFSFTRPLMGTMAKIVVYTADSLEAFRAAESAFIRMKELNQSLSDYLDESELSQLSNTHDQWVPISDDLWNVLSAAQQTARLSDGAFDVSIGPLTLLWRQAIDRNLLPDTSVLQQRRALVGYEFVQMNEADQTVRLEKKNMRLDLGGIAKGYAADQALDVLVQRGITSAVVDVGGDIALGDAPPDADGWSIQVFEGEANRMILTNCGIAVSGDTYRYLIDRGVRYSHIVDPKTGYGVTYQRHVAVIASSTMIADAWASTYSVMEWGSVVSDVQIRDTLSVYIVETEKEVQTGRFQYRN